jgi:hypothetical protein
MNLISSNLFLLLSPVRQDDATLPLISTMHNTSNLSCRLQLHQSSSEEAHASASQAPFRVIHTSNVSVHTKTKTARNPTALKGLLPWQPRPRSALCISFTVSTKNRGTRALLVSDSRAHARPLPLNDGARIVICKPVGLGRLW